MKRMRQSRLLQFIPRSELVRLLSQKCPAPPTWLLEFLQSSESESYEGSLVPAHEVHRIYQRRLQRMKTASPLREETRRFVSSLDNCHEQHLVLIVIREKTLTAGIWLTSDARSAIAVISKDNE